MCSGFILFYLELWSSMGDNIFFDMWIFQVAGVCSLW